MIVKWKRISALEYTAQWEARRLRLLWDSGQHNWRVWVDGSRVKERYGSVTSAMDAVESEVNARLVEIGATARARQRDRTTRPDSGPLVWHKIASTPARSGAHAASN